MKNLTALLLGLITLLFATSTPAQVSSDQARMYQINATHTGSIASAGLTPPLKQKWSRSFGQNMSFPLIADGRVFVTVRYASSYGTQLYALDKVTGATLWSFPLGGNYFWSSLCYENGRVFAISGSGLLRAFDPATGSVIWSRQLSGTTFSSAPSVFEGVIYTSNGGGQVYAVSADTGVILWIAQVINGDNSSPAVTTEGLYVTYAGPNYYKLNRNTGAQIWRYNPCCSGGGGKTPVLYNGRLYAREYNPDYILDSLTGGVTGSFISKSAPVFWNNTAVYMNGPKYFGSYGVLEARDVNTNMLLWTFGGDGQLQSGMLVVNDFVYVGSNSGKLYAVDAATGAQAWTTTVGTSIPYIDEQNLSQPLTGFAAGEGILVIPTTTTLVAYEGDHTPTITWNNKVPAPNAAGWNNTPVDFHFTPAAHPAGVTFSMPGSPLQFTAEGANQTQQVTVSDQAGNSATITSPAVNIDWTAPVTNKTLTGTVGGNVTAWYSTAVQVTLSASDSLSGIKNTFYRIDGGTTQTYVGPFSLSTDGIHNVDYWSTDSAGNVEAEKSVPVKIDRSLPSTQISANDSWYSNPTQVSLSATDAWSGVANTYYEVDSGPTQTYSGPFTVAGDFSHLVVYWSVDAVGNTEAKHYFTLKVDGSPATSYLSTAGTNGWNGWYISPAQVTLWSQDMGSGVAAIHYTVDGGPTQTYSGPFTVDGSAVHQINFWSVDNVGNTEVQKTATVKIDKEGPVTEISLSGPAGNNNYFKGSVQFTLTATDNVSGLASYGTYYQVDAGPNKVFMGSPITVSGDGTHTVSFWSQDMASNTASPNTITINIDSAAPATQAALAGTAAGGGWYSTPVQVTLSATDNHSGVDSTFYAVDGGVSQAYGAPFTLSNTGTHTILFWSVDRAGNAESQQQMIIKVDVSAPSTTAAVYGSWYDVWYQSPAQVGFTTSDGDSGVANTYYTVDGGATQTYSGLVSISGGGDHTVNYWSVDTAGNAETQKTLTVKIDNTAPTTQLAASGTAGSNGWYRSAVQVSLNASDTQVGVNVTLYRVDGGPTLVYSGPFNVSGDGQHQVIYYSNDKVSNTEAQQTATIKIDSTVPTAQSSVSAPAGGNGYYKGAAQVTLTAADNLSGVANKFYRVDGGATQTYGSPFSVSGDGNHSVDFWSVDLAGNTSNVGTTSVNIDTTAPLSQASKSGTAGTNGWYLGTVQVSLSAADTLSGVQTTFYKIDTGTTKTYTVPFSVTGNGPHTVTFWSVDKATNTEATRSLAVNIDPNAPSVTINASPANTNKSNNPVTVTISGKVTDTISGVLMSGATYSVVDEYGITQPSGAVTLQTTGNYSFTLVLPATRNPGDSYHLYTIKVQGFDQAGNLGFATATVKIN